MEAKVGHGLDNSAAESDAICSWDEWVPNERVLAWTEENLTTQKDLRDARKSATESRRKESAPKATGSTTKEGANAAAANDSKGVKRGRDTDIEKV